MNVDKLLDSLSHCTKIRQQCADELAEAVRTIKKLSSALHTARTQVMDLELKVTEIQKARMLKVEVPKSWGWSDCFFCGEPIKDDKNHDVFMGKSIHKQCRGKLIDGLNASYREKEKREKEKNES